MNSKFSYFKIKNELIIYKFDILSKTQLNIHEYLSRIFLHKYLILIKDNTVYSLKSSSIFVSFFCTECMYFSTT